MHRVRNIIFDLGGVILNIDLKLTERAFGDLGVMGLSSFFGHGFAASFFKDYEIGGLTDAQFIERLRRLSPRDLPDSLIIKAWNALLLDFPRDRICLLKALGSQYRLFLFSNTNSLHYAAFHRIYRDSFSGEDFDLLFARTYYSHLLGKRKPDVDAYLHIIGECQLKPSETLFVDDARVNAEAATQAGMTGYFLEPGKTILDIDFSSWGQ